MKKLYTLEDFEALVQARINEAREGYESTKNHYAPGTTAYLRRVRRHTTDETAYRRLLNDIDALRFAEEEKGEAS